MPEPDRLLRIIGYCRSRLRGAVRDRAAWLDHAGQDPTPEMVVGVLRLGVPPPFSGMDAHAPVHYLLGHLECRCTPDSAERHDVMRRQNLTMPKALRFVGPPAPPGRCESCSLLLVERDPDALARLSVVVDRLVDDTAAFVAAVGDLLPPEMVARLAEAVARQRPVEGSNGP